MGKVPWRAFRADDRFGQDPDNEAFDSGPNQVRPYGMIAFSFCTGGPRSWEIFGKPEPRVVRPWRARAWDGSEEWG